MRVIVMKNLSNTKSFKLNIQFVAKSTSLEQSIEVVGNGVTWGNQKKIKTIFYNNKIFNLLKKI